jgi:hypothetical protein
LAMSGMASAIVLKMSSISNLARAGAQAVVRAQAAVAEVRAGVATDVEPPRFVEDFLVEVSDEVPRAGLQRGGHDALGTFGQDLAQVADGAPGSRRSRRPRARLRRRLPVLLHLGGQQ